MLVTSELRLNPVGKQAIVCLIKNFPEEDGASNLTHIASASRLTGLLWRNSFQKFRQHY